MSEKTRRLPVLPHAGGVGRRDILQGLLAGVGAGLAVPGLADERPAALEPTAAAALRETLDAPGSKPQFFDEHQMATLQALCERVVPGSEEALAARFIDSLLAVDTQERKRRFLSAFGALEGEALARHQKPFRALAAAEQEALLAACAAAEPGRKEWSWTPGMPATPPPAEPEVLTLRDHFDHLKSWIADAYYSSAQGRKELGDMGHAFFAAFPDCKHEDHA